MSLTLQYSDPRGIDEPAALVSLGSNVRYGKFSVTLSAELGQAAMSTLEIEDPNGAYDLVGLRAFDSRETSAASNNSVIGRFVMQDRVIGRDAERALITGTARLWSVDLTDYNWHLSSRIHTDADAKRPVETAGDRLRWLLTRAAHINLNDYGNVSYPTAEMDAADYRGQRAADLLADCAVESGYNFWCDFNEAHGKPELFFLDPDGTSYEATIAVSNVIGDVDSLTTFFPSMDGEVRRSPSRLTYGVYLAYANGAVYVRNDTVGEQFGTIDQTAPMSNVKTRARALRVANKFLADNDEEDDRLVYEIIVPRAQVNDVRHGQRMSARFQHIPGYESARYVRVVKKSVIQDEALGEDFYRLALEAVPQGPVPYAGSVDITGDQIIPNGGVAAESFSFENDTTYTWTVTAVRLSGGAAGTAWSWTLAPAGDNYNGAVRSLFDDAIAWRALGPHTTGDAHPATGVTTASNWPTSGAGPYTASGTFTTPDNVGFDASLPQFFSASQENSPHDGSVFRWTWDIRKVLT